MEAIGNSLAGRLNCYSNSGKISFDHDILFVIVYMRIFYVSRGQGMKQVQDFIRERNMIMAGDRVIVGVSGGADSVCLFFELLDYQSVCEFSFEVVHIEHGIRGQESLDDAVFVEKLCRKYGILFHLYQFDIGKLAKEKKLTVEEAGRRVRYETFEQVRKKRGADKIAVAHNMEDQAETILMNLARGSGLLGLGGIWPVRGRIIRPLLNTGRAQIECSLRERNQDWKTDRTNLEADYTRNRLRLEILPLLSSEINVRAAEHIAAAGMRLQRAEAYLEHETRRLSGQLVISEENAVKIRRSEFLMQERLMQEYVVRYCLELLFVGKKDVGQVHIDALCELAAKENGKAADLPNGICAKNKNEYLVLEKKCRKVKKKEAPAEAQMLAVPGVTRWGGFRITTAVLPFKKQIIPEKKYTKWLDYDTIKHRLQIRTRQPGDYLTINAEGGRKTLKKYFIEEKVLQEERERIPLIADGNHIVWVLGHRISAAYKADGHTQRILKIQIDKEKKNGG